MAAIVLPQPGVFALGTPVQLFLELDLRGADRDPMADARTLAELVAGIKPSQGCNVVLGIRPSLWRRMAPQDCPPDVHDFATPVVGDDGFRMPATQADLLVWVAAGSRDSAYDEARRALATLGGMARLVRETDGWNYHGNVDLTGFTDGSENPTVAEAADVCLIADGPGAGSSVLLLQEWRHDLAAWDAAGVTIQEAAIGRTKADNVELDPKPPSAHNARTDQDEAGHILRKNVPIGGVADPGTLFVGLSASQAVLQGMLVRMVGIGGEPRDALTRFSTPKSGSYYLLPPATAFPGN